MYSSSSVTATWRGLVQVVWLYGSRVVLIPLMCYGYDYEEEGSDE